ncbi:hypothetical protein JCM8097_007006 [Rhodosporidiobolus ruineniae]
MPGLLDLPDELLLRVAGHLGSDLKVYSPRERQTDLARLAPVHSTLCSVARTLLYGDHVNVRSAGRTFLLCRTLLANPDVAALVRHLVAKSENDNGHPTSLVQIIQSTRLSSVTLSALFLTKHTSFELYSALQAQRRLVSFSYGFHGIDSPLAPIAPLLQAWPGLKQLSIDRIGAAERTGSVDSLSLSREVRSWGPSPGYQLHTLAVANCRIIDTVPYSLAAFKWLLGSSTSLVSLSLVGFDGLFDLAELFSLLASKGCDQTLERLEIRNFRDANERDLDDPDLISTAFDPNALSTYFPNLSYLSLANNDDETCFSFPSPFLRLPPNLRILKLHEDLFLDWRLRQSVEEGVPASLRKIKLVGPFPSDPDVKALRVECEERGVSCEVERSFSSL